MQKTLELLKATGDELRLRILALAAEGHLTMKDMSQLLSLSLPRLSWHVKQLVDCGLLVRSKEKNSVYLRLTNDPDVRGLADHVLRLAMAESRSLSFDQKRLTALLASRGGQADALMHAYLERWNEDRALFADEQAAEETVARLVADHPAEAPDLLDVGTGTGRLLERLAPLVRSGTGIDIDHEMLAIARSGIDQSDHRNLSIRYANLYDLPFEAGAFGVVTLYQVLHFVDDPQSAVEQAADMLGAGGQLIVADFLPHQNSALTDTYGHLWQGFAEQELAGWLQAAELADVSVTRVPGQALEVGVWSAVKPQG